MQDRIDKIRAQLPETLRTVDDYSNSLPHSEYVALRGWIEAAADAITSEYMRGVEFAICEIMNGAGISGCYEIKKSGTNDIGMCSQAADRIKAELAALKEATAITGETSDGYHTFNELYHHRAILFAVICNHHPRWAWKSKQHHDGTMYEGMFIVGLETPDGHATYHYDIDPYWHMFPVKELERAPEWDGHTPAQAIERIRVFGLIPAAHPEPFEWPPSTAQPQEQKGE